jgi:hypothetical protein
LPRKISLFVRERVRKRANYLCEYCHTNERWQLVQFTIDHVLPTKQGGDDSLDNLALACFHCNRRKSDKQFIGKTPLFNPREMSWSEHFFWSADGLQILAKTEIGRATIGLLELNRDRALLIRLDDAQINRHPPADDPVQSSD